MTRIDLDPIAVDIARSLVSGFPNQAVQDAIDRLAKADAIIASTPVYKAGISGLFKSFADLIDNDLLIGPDCSHEPPARALSRCACCLARTSTNGGCEPNVGSPDALAFRCGR